MCVSCPTDISSENMEAEWKQMLEDSGITEDLQIGWENDSGLKGKWSKISLMSNFNGHAFVLLFSITGPNFMFLALFYQELNRKMRF